MTPRTSNGCGNTDRTVEAGANCPVNGSAGTRVDLQTVKALLTSAALQRLEPAAYRFCPTPDCDVVYFDDRGYTFTTADVRVGVWQKQREGSRILCYCFGENEAESGVEIALEGRSGAAERVREHIRAGWCACEIRNPRGSWCLGDVSAAVKRIASTAEALVVEGASCRLNPVTHNGSER